jgi:hypothetical protein
MQATVRERRSNVVSAASAVADESESAAAAASTPSATQHKAALVPAFRCTGAGHKSGIAAPAASYLEISSGTLISRKNFADLSGGYMTLPTDMIQYASRSRNAIMGAAAMKSTPNMQLTVASKTASRWMKDLSFPQMHPCTHGVSEPAPRVLQ